MRQPACFFSRPYFSCAFVPGLHFLRHAPTSTSVSSYLGDAAGLGAPCSTAARAERGCWSRHADAPGGRGEHRNCLDFSPRLLEAGSRKQLLDPDGVEGGGGGSGVRGACSGLISVLTVRSCSVCGSVYACASGQEWAREHTPRLCTPGPLSCT